MIAPLGIQTSSSMPLHRWMALSLLSGAFLMGACNRQEAPTPAADAVVEEKATPAAGESSKADDVLNDPWIREAGLTSAGQEAEIDPLLDEALGLVDEHPDATAVELLNLPEVNPHLVAGLQALGKNEALKKLIDRNVDLAAQLSGLSDQPGAARLDLDTSGYDSARKARMLQAVLSEDPRRIVGFIADEIGEALPDLMYGEGERAPNGVAIVPKDPPQQP